MFVVAIIGNLVLFYSKTIPEEVTPISWVRFN